MSGPKDFEVIFALARLANIQARRRAAADAQAAAVAERLRTARLRAHNATAAPARAARAAQEAKLDELRRANERSLLAAQQAARTTAIPPEAHVPAPATTNAAARDQAAELRDLLQTVAGWRDALHGDAAVTTFRGADASTWRTRSEALERAMPADGADPAASLAQAKALLAEAEALHHEAGETQDKFDTRNELLQDVIASLKEIGFFVDDPRYANPQDPAGPVVLKAVRGDEEMTASIDLSETVRSVWDGIADERCKESFFQYVDQMKARGVEVKPQREDLQNRPTLKQKSANELPRSQSSGR